VISHNTVVRKESGSTFTSGISNKIDNIWILADWTNPSEGDVSWAIGSVVLEIGLSGLEDVFLNSVVAADFSSVDFN